MVDFRHFSKAAHHCFLYDVSLQVLNCVPLQRGGLMLDSWTLDLLLFHVLLILSSFFLNFGIIFHVFILLLLLFALPFVFISWDGCYPPFLLINPLLFIILFLFNVFCYVPPISFIPVIIVY